MPVIPHQHRKSLAEASPELNIPRPTNAASQSCSTSPTKKSQRTISKMNNLHASISESFSSGWPSWRSTRKHQTSPIHFTVRLAAHLREEAAKMALPESPAIIIVRAREESLKGGLAAFEEVWDNLETSLVTLVYGSNLIERAGTNFRLTFSICRDIFRGKEVDPNIEERSPEYQEHLDYLVKTQRKGVMSNVVRSRREVINHAKALNFLIDRVVLDNMALSEELILEAHRILQHNIGDDDVTPGEYREHEVAVSYSKPGQKRQKNICIRAKAVPEYMERMIGHLGNEIAAAEDSEEMDPYTLAARYHHQFVMIHPFGDGNGRMSRIILNLLLLKYAGHLSIMGSDGDQEEYLDIVRQGSRTFHKEDMEVGFEEQTSHLEFAQHLIRKSKTGLENMWSWATQRRK